MPRLTHRIDWSAMVFDLERCGMSQREIGAACDMDASWANKLKNLPGTQPRFHNGALLLGLWAERMALDPATAAAGVARRFVEDSQRLSGHPWAREHFRQPGASMSKASRTIQTPGAPPTDAADAAPTAGAAGTDTGADEFDSDEPPTDAEPPNAQDLQMELAQSMQREKQLAARNASFEARFAALEGKKAAQAPAATVLTQAEAIAQQEAEFAAGKSPRSLLTVDGWVVHPSRGQSAAELVQARAAAKRDEAMAGALQKIADRA